MLDFSDSKNVVLNKKIINSIILCMVLILIKNDENKNKNEGKKKLLKLKYFLTHD
jgi:hypothetical protein